MRPSLPTLQRSLWATGIAAAVAASLAFLPQRSIEGRAFVIDGDTIVVNHQHIRISGIDAPESEQWCSRSGHPYPCGSIATSFMRQLVAGRTVICQPETTDKYGRTVATCFAGDVDLGRAMVSSGMAICYRHFSTIYSSDEDQAKAERRGIWSGTFEEPYRWRLEHRSASRE